MTVSNLETVPEEIICAEGGRTAAIELLAPREVPLGGPSKTPGNSNKARSQHIKQACESAQGLPDVDTPRRDRQNWSLTAVTYALLSAFATRIHRQKWMFPVLVHCRRDAVRHPPAGGVPV